MCRARNPRLRSTPPSRWHLRTHLAAFIMLTAALLPGLAHAEQGVEPELTLGVLTLGSATGDFATGANPGHGNIGVVDFSDTALLLRGRTQLYRGIRGGSVFGLQFPDADSKLGVVFFHQAYVFVQSRHLDIKVGRSRLLSSIIEFPTVRDNDLLPFTDALNPFSDGSTTEDHQYGNVLEISGNIASKYFLSVHAEHLFLTPGDQNSVDFSLNSIGTTLSYKNIPARINNGRVRRLGVGFNYYDAKGDKRPATWNVIAGGAINLLPDPIHLVDFRLQAIYNNGDARTAMTDANSTYRIRSLRVAGALRYLYAKAMIPTFQLALVGGYARYGDDGSADSLSGVINGFYSLGGDFDVGVQYQLRRDSAQVRGALDTPELAHAAQVVLRFGYELTVNALPNRDSVLNNEHGYIP